jgi:hypothetical protein
MPDKARTLPIPRTEPERGPLRRNRQGMVEGVGWGAKSRSATPADRGLANYLWVSEPDHKRLASNNKSRLVGCVYNRVSAQLQAGPRFGMASSVKGNIRNIRGNDETL